MRKREELGTFVNLRAKSCVAMQLVMWQTRIGATHVFTVDASTNFKVVHCAQLADGKSK